MKSKRLLLILVFAVASSSFGYAAVIKDISSNIFLQMSANAGCGDLTVNSSDSQVGKIKNLKASIGATTSCTGPKTRVNVTGEVKAKWNNAADGTVDFVNLGWKTKNVTSGYANDNEGLDYSYTFTTK